MYVHKNIGVQCVQKKRCMKHNQFKICKFWLKNIKAIAQLFNCLLTHFEKEKYFAFFKSIFKQNP